MAMILVLKCSIRQSNAKCQLYNYFVLIYNINIYQIYKMYKCIQVLLFINGMINEVFQLNPIWASLISPIATSLCASDDRWPVYVGQS